MSRTVFLISLALLGFACGKKTEVAPQSAPPPVSQPDFLTQLTKNHSGSYISTDSTLHIGSDQTYEWSFTKYVIAYYLDSGTRRNLTAPCTFHIQGTIRNSDKEYEHKASKPSVFVFTIQGISATTAGTSGWTHEACSIAMQKMKKWKIEAQIWMDQAYRDSRWNEHFPLTLTSSDHFALQFTLSENADDNRKEGGCDFYKDKKYLGEGIFVKMGGRAFASSRLLEKIDGLFGKTQDTLFLIDERNRKITISGPCGFRFNADLDSVAIAEGETRAYFSNPKVSTPSTPLPGFHCESLNLNGFKEQIIAASFIPILVDTDFNQISLAYGSRYSYRSGDFYVGFERP